MSISNIDELVLFAREGLLFPIVSSREDYDAGLAREIAGLLHETDERVLADLMGYDERPRDFLDDYPSQPPRPRSGISYAY